jgi:hypothetical protein
MAVTALSDREGCAVAAQHGIEALTAMATQLRLSAKLERRQGIAGVEFGGVEALSDEARSKMPLEALA